MHVFNARWPDAEAKEYLMSIDWIPSMSGIAIAIFALITTMIIPLVAVEVANAQDRPSAILYDQPGTIPTLQAEPLRSSHRRIIIRDHSLEPREIRLKQGEPFAWVSLSRAASRIIFERESARGMICHSLVNFSIEEDELKSSELQLTDVANFCDLEPGRYRYHVNRADISSGASRRLDGVVVVTSDLAVSRTSDFAKLIPDWSPSENQEGFSAGEAAADPSLTK
jgi:hypothetical protein